MIFKYIILVDINITKKLSEMFLLKKIFLNFDYKKNLILMIFNHNISK